MPTPDGAMLSPPAEHESPLAGRTTCPPEDVRVHSSLDMNGGRHYHAQSGDTVAHTPPMQQPTPPPAERDLTDAQPQDEELQSKSSEPEVDGPIRDIPTPVSSTDDAAEERRNSQVSPLSVSAPAPVSWSQPTFLTSPFPGHRFLPYSSSSLLRPGSRFVGSQTSDRQKYEVEVEIKHVDMRESFLCGYLRIKGLTEDHPSLTTYFESEIIGNKYSFITQHPEWGSNEKVDRQHWGRFAAYKKISSSRGEPATRDWMQKEHLFMRWKEYFLVPDHRVKTINGASFEGFYYICFNQVMGSIEGIYFHAKSEKYQKLQLEHIEDHGCQGAMEFR
ncbi:vacuolar import and degradation protein-domain-containing protein [Clohesyomyces aquaticus]|uniref:Vacuolar import and degradation protein-domain-containing protein n=1 Tax=Clohesyomyces aquaticus TaxID=1231657 RepID=A0A1Y1Z8S0_9PLEO|nr:vacuolar import and degradation protein-domain-containing protein [Clohesyomyces aquaticus]